MADIQQQPSVQQIAPPVNVDFANNAIKANPTFFNTSPQLAAEALASGNQETITAVAATNHVMAYAKAFDDHLETYNSHVWMANALKAAPDIAKAVIPNPMEKLMAGGR